MNSYKSTKHFIVYADFNCPFCYALNEHVHALKLQARVEWRPIQHAVNASSKLCSFESLSELASEVSEVRPRMPATESRVPVVQRRVERRLRQGVECMAWACNLRGGVH